MIGVVVIFAQSLHRSRLSRTCGLIPAPAAAAQHMKQRDFNAFRSPKAERFSGSQFHDAVQTLDNARRYGAFGPEPVEDQMPVTPQAGCCREAAAPQPTNSTRDPF
jgi:hypothetical protein